MRKAIATVKPRRSPHAATAAVGDAMARQIRPSNALGHQVGDSDRLEPTLSLEVDVCAKAQLRESPKDTTHILSGREDREAARSDGGGRSDAPVLCSWADDWPYPPAFPRKGWSGAPTSAVQAHTRVCHLVPFAATSALRQLAGKPRFVLDICCGARLRGARRP